MNKHSIGSILIVGFGLIGFYKGYEKEVYLLIGIAICLFFCLYVLTEALFDIDKKLDKILDELKNK
jgi:hypothetical protein